MAKALRLAEGETLAKSIQMVKSFPFANGNFCFTFSSKYFLPFQVLQ